MHRLQPGLPGYLIPFAPLAFVPHRQARSSLTLSPLVVPQGLSHFTATPGIPLPSPELKLDSFPRSSPVEPGDFTRDLSGRLRALYAQ